MTNHDKDRKEEVEVPYPINPDEGDGNQFPKPDPTFPNPTEKPGVPNDDKDIFYLNNKKEGENHAGS